MKSRYEILKEAWIETNTPYLKGQVFETADEVVPRIVRHGPYILSAMQTYHDEGCVEFHNWAEIYVETTPLESKVPTTTELLKLWKDEKGIV